MNSGQRIDVANRSVSVVLASGNRLCGKVFLHLQNELLSGPERVSDALNNGENFLALETDEGIELLNLDMVISVSVAAEEEIDPLLTLGNRRRIWLQTALGEEFTAEIYINLPSDKTRVKDFLNQPSRFLPILHQDKIIYIARNRIMSVRDEKLDS
jgi:hypothetical protein